MSCREAIAEEFKSLEENKTWKVVNLLPRDKKAIHSKWVFSIKDDGRYKAGQRFLQNILDSDS